MGHRRGACQGRGHQRCRSPFAALMCSKMHRSDHAEQFQIYSTDGNLVRASASTIEFLCSS